LFGDFRDCSPLLLGKSSRGRFGLQFGNLPFGMRRLVH
jgi:hypothetical protein